jgi:hypothetical protein
MSDETLTFFTSDKPHVARTLTMREYADASEAFANELCDEIRKLQEQDKFTPENVASFVRRNRFGMRLLMQRGR